MTYNVIYFLLINFYSICSKIRLNYEINETKQILPLANLPRPHLLLMGFLVNGFLMMSFQTFIHEQK